MKQIDACARIRSGTVVHRTNLELRLEHLEAAFDVGERLVTRDYVLGGQPLHIGHQQQFAVHPLGQRASAVVAEPLRGQVDLEYFG